MAERNNHQPDGGQANEDEQVALNPDATGGGCLVEFVPETKLNAVRKESPAPNVVEEQKVHQIEPEFRTSKSSLSKSKEKVSADGAEEKLLSKEEEAKIVTRVDMADAKYHHSNGDTKIELDANKRQFSGLTKEELLKYADDPFWVNLRWFMFVLFWAMWACMLAGAIAIIVRAPKCAPPTPRTWFEKGPLVELEGLNYGEIEELLPQLQSNKVEGVFVEVLDSTYDVLDKPDYVDKFKAFVAEAKKFGVKVIVDLIPNYVSITHKWFELSENRTGEFAAYFVWADSDKYETTTNQKEPPNNWKSTLNTSAWTYNEKRRQFYLHQFAENQPDLDFHNEKVVQQFSNVLDMWMKTGIDGVRLVKARQMLVNVSSGDEWPAQGRGAAHDADQSQYAFYKHTHTVDLPSLDLLLAKYADQVAAHNTEPTVFTLKEEGDRAELYLLDRNVTSLRPPSAAPVTVRDFTAVKYINKRLVDDNNVTRWPAMQLKSDSAERELASFSLLLPATSVLSVQQLDTNSTSSESLVHLVQLRSDASVEHGQHVVTVVPAANTGEELLIACARWKPGHTGYVAVFNPSGQELRANLTALPSIPDSLTIHHVSHEVRAITNYTTNLAVSADNALVPSHSTVVLSYVPNTTAEH